MKKISCFLLLFTVIFGGLSAQELEWVKKIDQTSGDHFTDMVRVYDIEKDDNDNVYVTGTMSGIIDFDPSNSGGVISAYYVSLFSQNK